MQCKWFWVELHSGWSQFFTFLPFDDEDDEDVEGDENVEDGDENGDDVDDDSDGDYDDGQGGAPLRVESTFHIFTFR